MRKSIIVAVLGMMAAGLAQTMAQSNWDQTVTFTLISQTATGKKTISTKNILNDLRGASVTNSVTNVTSVTNSATVTNSPIFTLASGQDYTTNASHLTNTVTITFTNAEVTNVQVISTQTATNPPTFTFNNTAVTSTNNETQRVLTNVPAGAATAVLVTTNGPVFTVTVITTTSVATNTPVAITNFSKTAKLVVRQASPSGGTTNANQFIIREGSGSKAVDVADVTPFFTEKLRTKVDQSKGSSRDFDFAYHGVNITFDTRGAGTEIDGLVHGASERKSIASTIVGSGTVTNTPAVISGKYNISGGKLE